MAGTRGIEPHGRSATEETAQSVHQYIRPHKLIKLTDVVDLTRIELVKPRLRVITPDFQPEKHPKDDVLVRHDTPFKHLRIHLGLSLFMKAPHREDTAGCNHPTFKPKMVEMTGFEPVIT